MEKIFCDRCGEEKTRYAHLGYFITISHTQKQDLCDRCMKEIEKYIRKWMKNKNQEASHE